MAETFEQINKRRQERLARIKKDNDKLSNEQNNLKTINNNTPENQKPRGSAKFGQFILNLGLQIYNQVIPVIENNITEIGFDKIEQQKLDPALTRDLLSGKIDPNVFFSKLNINPNDLSTICPTEEKINQIISIRNNLVTNLNSINNKLEFFNRSLNNISSAYDIGLSLIQTIDIARTTLSIGSKLIPSPPGVPGIAVSTISDLSDAKFKILFNSDGSLKLSKLKAIFDSTAMALNVTSGYIKTAINLLNLLDILIKSCNANANLDDVSSNLTILANQLNVADLDNTYKGFTFEIETVPFNNTINRKKAIAINKSGIKLLETELSFTSNDLILIDELKFIIDRDNLKAD